MSTFTNTWSPSTPAGSAVANTLDTVLQTDKAALAERLLLEHYPISQTVSKENKLAALRHRPGLVSCAFKGTTAEIAALVASNDGTGDTIDGFAAFGPGEGALAFDTTTNTLKRFSSADNAFLPVAGIGAAADAISQINLGVQQNFIDNFSQNIHNTTGRTQRWDLTVIVGDPSDLPNTLVPDYAFGFLTLNGAYPNALTIVTGAAYVRKLDSSAPDNFMSCYSWVVPPGYQHFIRTYAYIKSGGSWSCAIDNANFWTFAVQAQRLKTISLVRTQL